MKSILCPLFNFMTPYSSQSSNEQELSGNIRLYIYIIQYVTRKNKKERKEKLSQKYWTLCSRCNAHGQRMNFVGSISSRFNAQGHCTYLAQTNKGKVLKLHLYIPICSKLTVENQGLQTTDQFYQVPTRIYCSWHKIKLNKYLM